MATKTDKNLYNVRVNSNYVITHIEAKNAIKAINSARKTCRRDFNANEPIAVVGNPIFEKQIGLETIAPDYEMETEDFREDDVFEIVVRGTSENRVDRLARALLFAIGGMAAHFENEEKDSSDLRDFLAIREEFETTAF